MRKPRARKSILFLIELTVTIALFAVAGVLCVKSFYEARNMNTNSQIYNTLTNEYSAIAEEVSAADSVSQVTDYIIKKYPYCSMTKCIDETTFTVAFGPDNKPMNGEKDNGEIGYVMQIKLEYPDEMLVATMTSTGSDYTLTAKHNLKGITK